VSVDIYRPYGVKVRKQYPCPGCGAMQWAPATELCGECRRNLERGKAALAEHHARVADGEIVYVRAGHQWVYGSQAGDLHFTKYHAADFVRDLGLLVKPSAEACAYQAPKQDIDRGDMHGWVTPETADRIKRMLAYLESLLRHVYGCGFKDGRNLLAGLASGDITAKELSKREARHQ
jgi:hypothetical protein